MRGLWHVRFPNVLTVERCAHTTPKDDALLLASDNVADLNTKLRCESFGAAKLVYEFGSVLLHVCAMFITCEVREAHESMRV